MSDYDFKTLNDKEFESLCTDLLSGEMNQRIERFKSGKDGGVDGRYFSTSNDEVIIQCKHWIKTGISSLINRLKKDEIKKLNKLQPSRYIFTTSLELSRQNKQDIQKALHPYILSESYIYGAEDLNDLLKKFSDVERNHYKLWLASTTVLTSILNNAIYGRSKSKLKEISNTANLYVYTENFDRALKKAEKQHIVIITGEPGIGKTTLADQLCLHYSADGYELVLIENSLNEAENIFQEDKKQLFYFDDFLGRNFLEALSSHQDSHIVGFIKRISLDKTKRFILTSRTNIINKGKELSDLFQINKIEKKEYLISISKLSDLDKAKILYNHIWFGSLDPEFIDEIYKEQRYKNIINHANFNPRLIQYITDVDRLNGVLPVSYWTYIENSLNNPKDIWRNVFEVQLDEVCRLMVLGVFIHGTTIDEKELENFFNGLINQYFPDERRSFETISKILTGSLLNRQIISPSKVVYDLFNPSIGDYIIANQLKNEQILIRVINSLRSYQSCDNLYNLKSKQIITDNSYSRILHELLDKISLENTSINQYVIKLIKFVKDTNFNNNQVITNYITNICLQLLNYDSTDLTNDILQVITFSISNGLIQKNNFNLNHALLNWIIIEKDIEPEHYEDLSQIVDLIAYKSLTETLKSTVLDYYKDAITYEITGSGSFEHIFNIEEFVDNDLLEFIEDILQPLYLSFDESDIEDIMENIDFEHIVDENQQSEYYYQEQAEKHREHSPMSPNSTLDSENYDPIEDLFDRS